MIHSKHTKMKIILVMISEFIGFQLDPVLQLLGVNIEANALTSFLVGSLLAVVTIGIYEYIIMRSAMKLQRELSDILNHMLCRYDTRFEKGGRQGQKGGK